jgi:hypothetical protein
MDSASSFFSRICYTSMSQKRSIERRYFKMFYLRLGVFVSFGLSLILLTYLVLHTFCFGKRRLHSKAEAARWKGVAYAFSLGMLPWEKESAAKHLPTYVAGIFYHTGIFAAIFYVLFWAASLSLSEVILSFFRALLAVGFICGTGLLLKRAVKRQMRYISCPDDFAANILVDLFILSGFLSSLRTAAIPIFCILAILTFLYMPLGKIRHCFFFFYSRILFGSYFGRRGVLPHSQPSKD